MVCFHWSSPTLALNLPGVAPKAFETGDSVTLKANKVTSMRTPVQYDYYDLPFCKRRRTKAKAENLGERLSGDSLTTSPYEVRAAATCRHPPLPRSV